MGNPRDGVRVIENPNELYAYSKHVRPSYKPVLATSHPAKLNQKAKQQKIFYWIVSRPSSKILNSSSTLLVSPSLAMDYPAICPNLLADYIHINPDDRSKQDFVLSRTSLCLYVIRGCDKTKTVSEGEVNWSKGDFLAIQYHTEAIEHSAEEDTAFYYMHDGPLLKYLRENPSETAIVTAVFREKVLKDKVESTLIGNPQTSETRSLTATLWALFNVLPANSMQKPHRHNAVALDSVISAPKGKCYILIDDELDDEGKVKSLKRLDWRSDAAFTTPLSLWHSHHNESEDEDAWILPVQDAGLSLHHVKLRYSFRLKTNLVCFVHDLCDIRFTDEEWKYLHDKHAIKSIIY